MARTSNRQHSRTAAKPSRSARKGVTSRKASDRTESDKDTAAKNAPGAKPPVGRDAARQAGSGADAGARTPVAGTDAERAEQQRNEPATKPFSTTQGAMGTQTPEEARAEAEKNRKSFPGHVQAPDRSKE